MDVSSMREPLVACRKAGREFVAAGGRRVHALHDVDCIVRPGARIALVGPSGSGKTTLLHLMGGLDRPTSGSVEWPGLGRIEQLRPRQVGVVFQTPSLFPALTVAQNVTLPRVLAGDEESGGISALLQAFGIADLSEKLPEELSGGQAQRVAMARALVIGPRLILADEPTGQLDSATAQQVFDRLLERLGGSDTALVVATHDHAVAARMDEQWIMVHGQLIDGKGRPPS
jgi:ABC-type lipoprotein export system ATPase subunit